MGHERPKCQGNDIVSQVGGVDEFDAKDKPHDTCQAGAGAANSLATASQKIEVACSLMAVPGMKQIQTYNSPVAKTAETATFLLNGICSAEIQKIGSSNIVTSESTLIDAAEVIDAARFRQWPGTDGFQILRLGVQEKRPTKKLMM